MLSDKAMRMLTRRACHLAPFHRMVAAGLIIAGLLFTVLATRWSYSISFSTELIAMVAGVGILLTATVAGLYRDFVLRRQAQRIARVAREWPRSRIQALLKEQLSWRLRDAIEKLLQ